MATAATPVGAATPLLCELESVLGAFAALQGAARGAIVSTVTTLVADPATTDDERVAALALLTLARSMPAPE